MFNPHSPKFYFKNLFYVGAMTLLQRALVYAKPNESVLCPFNNKQTNIVKNVSTINQVQSLRLLHQYGPVPDYISL